MDEAIQLDDQPRGQAAEIDHEWSNDMLAPERYAQLLPAQAISERRLRWGLPSP